MFSLSNPNYLDDVKNFNERGFIVLKNVIPSKFKSLLRAEIQNRIHFLKKENRTTIYPQYPDAIYPLGDIFSFDCLKIVDYIFFNQIVLDTLRAILNTEKLTYFADSSINMGTSARGFHKDNVDRLDKDQPDWENPYGIIRMGFYFQDHKNHSGGLKIRLGSHMIADYSTGRPYDIKSEFGDVIIWNMRLTHSGNNRRLLLLNNTSVPPSIENRLPSFLFKPEEEIRIASFCAIAKPGMHLNHYIAYLNSRLDEYLPHFENAAPKIFVSEFLKTKGIDFISPIKSHSKLYLPNKI